MNEKLAKWKMPGLWHGADAQKVAEEIDSLGESVTAEELVEFAKDETTEAHKCFDWKDSVAAQKWRIHQARNVINGIVYVQSPKPSSPEYRMYYIGKNNTGYKPAEVIFSKPDQREELLNRAFLEFETFKKKYSMLEELVPLFNDADLLFRKLRGECG